MVVWLFGVLELGFRGLRLELEPGCSRLEAEFRMQVKNFKNIQVRILYS